MGTGTTVAVVAMTMTTLTIIWMRETKKDRRYERTYRSDMKTDQIGQGPAWVVPGQEVVVVVVVEVAAVVAVAVAVVARFRSGCSMCAQLPRL